MNNLPVPVTLKPSATFKQKRARTDVNYSYVNVASPTDNQILYLRFIAFRKAGNLVDLQATGAAWPNSPFNRSNLPLVTAFNLARIDLPLVQNIRGFNILPPRQFAFINRSEPMLMSISGNLRYVVCETPGVSTDFTLRTALIVTDPAVTGPGLDVGQVSVAGMDLNRPWPVTCAFSLSPDNWAEWVALGLFSPLDFNPDFPFTSAPSYEARTRINEKRNQLTASLTVRLPKPTPSNTIFFQFGKGSGSVLRSMPNPIFPSSAYHVITVAANGGTPGVATQYNDGPVRPFTDAPTYGNSTEGFGTTGTTLDFPTHWELTVESSAFMMTRQLYNTYDNGNDPETPLYKAELVKQWVESDVSYTLSRFYTTYEEFQADLLLTIPGVADIALTNINYGDGDFGVTWLGTVGKTAIAVVYGNEGMVFEVCTRVVNP
jgi:hypothetical protein